MEIELYGGPGDGMVLIVPDVAERWVINSPVMTPAQFLALESGAPNPLASVPQLSHTYAKTHFFGKHSGKRLFTYVGAARRAR